MDSRPCLDLGVVPPGFSSIEPFFDLPDVVRSAAFETLLHGIREVIAVHAFPATCMYARVLGII